MIEVVSGGLYTSMQDLGRYGYRRYGVPLSGAMDSYSARLANQLIGNFEGEAVMEITHIGPVLRFKNSTEIAITGAGFVPTLNDVEVSLNTRTYVPKDGILKFGLPGYGLRAYLSVLGGFNSEKKLGSYSQYFGITKKETIEKGDSFVLKPHKGKPHTATASFKVSKNHFSSNSIDVFAGPEFRLASKSIQKKILETELTIGSESNRMAYILKGWNGVSAQEIITAPVQPGTVQLTPSGQCLVLMRDAQTTGGYARVLQLTESSINSISQKRAGTVLHFKLIDYPS
jgi:biotin-dependent carboxylase-like uncharacterized protein